MPKLSSHSSSSYHFGSLPLWFVSAFRTAKMKGKSSGFLKQLASLLASIIKAKSTAVRSKTNSVKARLIIFGLIHNKKLVVGAVSDKIHALIGQEKGRGATATHDKHHTIEPYNAAANEALQKAICGEEVKEEDEEDEYFPNLRHSLFGNEDGELGDNDTGSVIGLLKSCRREDEGEFILEDDIDQAAELFIRRFHQRVRMRELHESSKWREEMLERSV